MLLSTTFSLEQIECREEHDNFGAEPYLWTAFFHADMGTFRNGNVADTAIPIASDAGRSFIPDGVNDGEILPIPALIGSQRFTIDASGPVTAGVLFVMIEENFSAQSAMAAGQAEFRDAFDELLDDFVLAHISDPPEQDDYDAFANELQSRVAAKVRASSGWGAYFKPQDRVLGYGVHLLTRDELVNVSLARSHTFSVSIAGARQLQGTGHVPPITVFDRYEVRGRVRARMIPPSLDHSAQSAYTTAVAAFEKVNAHVAGLRAKLATASRRERQELKEELRYQDSVVLAAAIDAVDATRRDYYEFADRTEAGKALIEQRSLRQRRCAERSEVASPLRSPRVTITRARIVNEASASETAPIDRSATASHSGAAADMTG